MYVSCCPRPAVSHLQTPVAIVMSATTLDWMRWTECRETMWRHEIMLAQIEHSTHILQHGRPEIKVKESRNRPSVAQRVPGGLGSQISMTFGTWRWWGRQPHAPAAFTPRKCSWYSFSLGAESTTGPWYGRKEYVTEKSSDTTGNRSRDRPTSSAAP